MHPSEISPDEVSARFNWAKRQGRPAWLWPDVSPERWRLELKSIEEAGRAVLSGLPEATLSGDDAATGLAAYTSGTGPLLGWWCERGLLSAPPETEALMSFHLQQNRERAARMAEEAGALVQALANRKMNVIVLKGAHTAVSYFPDPATRPAADIDLLVPSGDFKAAESLLEASGFVRCGKGTYESTWRRASMPANPRTLHFIHAEDPWSVDLHSSLNIVPAAGIPEARMDAAEPFASRREWPHCPDVRVLDQPQLLLYLAVHASAGLQNLTLLRLIELQLVIRKDAHSGRLNWDNFLETGRRAGCLRFAYPALQMCNKFIEGSVPEAVVSECRRNVPPAVLRVLDPLTPATAQRVERNSIAEHYMWSDGWRGRLRQLAADVVPVTSLTELWSVYERRARQLMRGRITR